MHRPRAGIAVSLVCTHNLHSLAFEALLTNGRGNEENSLRGEQDSYGSVA